MPLELLQTVDNPNQQEVCCSLQSLAKTVVNDPMEAAYIMVYMWARSGEKSG
jgi:hypothetical protein